MKKIRLILFAAIFSLFLLPLFQEASAFDISNIIYYGKSVVDLKVSYDGYSGSGQKVELLRDGSVLGEWSEGEPGMYYSDTVSPGIHFYSMAYYTWDSDKEEWVLSGESGNVEIDTTYARGTIYNGMGGDDPFGGIREPISWYQGAGHWYVTGVDVKSGYLSISEDVTVVFTREEDLNKDGNYFFSGGLSAFAPGQIAAEGVTFRKGDHGAGDIDLWNLDDPAFAVKDWTLEYCTLRLHGCNEMDIQGIHGGSISVSGNDNLIQDNFLYHALTISGEGNTIKRNIVTKTDPANPDEIRLSGSSRNNIIEENEVGTIELTGSDCANNIIRKNTTSSISVYGAGNLVEENTVTGRSLDFSLISVSGNNNFIKKNIITKCETNDYGIQIFSGAHTVEGNAIKGNGGRGSGIRVQSDNNSIKKNTTTRNLGSGITIANASFNNIENNACAGNETSGISLDNNSLENVVAFNHVWGNTVGIQIDGNYNGVHENIVEHSAGESSGDIIMSIGIGISLSQSAQNNIIYNNIFRYNEQNANDNGADNSWNHEKYAVNQNIVGGPYLAGNYWDDYTGVDGDADGIGDTPYAIPGQGGVSDNLPLVAPSQYPAMTVVPDPHNFSQVEVGAVSEPQTFTVTNTGEADIDVALFYISGAPGEFFIANNDCSGCTLAPGATCLLDVVFLPESEGAKTASLKLSSNASIDIPLSGNGVYPTIGDLNSDYEVTLTDAILALKVIIGLNPTGINSAADVNADSKIGLAEVIYILQYVAGLR